MGNLGITVEFLPRGKEGEPTAASAHARGKCSTRSARTPSLARSPARQRPHVRLRSCAVRILSSLSSSLSVRPLSLRLRRPRPPTQPRSRFIEREWWGELGLGGRRSALALAYSHVSHSVPLLPVSFPPSSRRLVLCLAPPSCVSCPVAAAPLLLDQSGVRSSGVSFPLPATGPRGRAPAGRPRPAVAAAAACCRGARAPPHPVLPIQCCSCSCSSDRSGPPAVPHSRSPSPSDSVFLFSSFRGGRGRTRLHD